MKTKLDEMKEQKLLHIQSRCYKIGFWGLFVAILVQIYFIDGTSLRDIAAEIIIFIVMAVCKVYGCIKNGIWDGRFQPNLYSILLGSLISGAIVGFCTAVLAYRNTESLSSSLAWVCLNFTITFVACIIALSLTAKAYKKQLSKLENDEDNQDA